MKIPKNFSYNPKIVRLKTLKEVIALDSHLIKKLIQIIGFPLFPGM